MNASKTGSRVLEVERHLLGATPDVLEEIRDGGLSLVVWERRLPRGLTDALRRWVASSPPRYDGTAANDAWIEAALATFPDSPARAFLAADLAFLVGKFRLVAGKTALKVSFGTVTGDQCRKFHVDYQRLRLLTTYLGPGTEWLPEGAAAREALVNSAACPITANRLIVRQPDLVRHARAGDVLLLRGHDGVTGDALGAVHRSPPIEASGRARVVLVASV